MNWITKILVGVAVYEVLKPEKPEIGKLKTYRYVPVFDSLEGEKAKFNLGFTKGKSGVYLIKENGVLVYVGFSGYDLYKTISRHFQVWNSKKQETVTYVNSRFWNDYTIRVVFLSPTKALKLEQALILKHKPRDNSYMLNLLEMDAKEAAKIERQLDKAIEEYEESPKYDYPPEWDM
jgi:hypothetical protein